MRHSVYTPHCIMDAPLLDAPPWMQPPDALRALDAPPIDSPPDAPQRCTPPIDAPLPLRDGYCCSRYASYWNAFFLVLFTLVSLTKVVMKNSVSLKHIFVVLTRTCTKFPTSNLCIHSYSFTYRVKNLPVP